jgi:hypothetical protein
MPDQHFVQFAPACPFLSDCFARRSQLGDLEREE